MYKNLGVAAILAATLLLGVSAAQASDVTSQGGWFDGTSPNPNGAFTASTNNGYTIDLRAKNRQDPSVINPVGDVYSVAAGEEPSSPGHAVWNYEFSIGCNSGTCVAAGVLPTAMQNLLNDSTMTVKDLTAGTSNTISMATWADDSTWGTSGKSTLLDPTAFVAQNSENPDFSQFALNGSYGSANADYYEFDIDLYSDTAKSNLLDSDTMFVSVGGAQAPMGAPEAPTVAFLGAGLLGMVGFAFRKKRGGETSSMLAA